MEFVNKEYFILLTLLIPYIIWYWRNRKHSEPTMRVSTVVAYYKAPKSWRQRIVHTPIVFALPCFCDDCVRYGTSSDTQLLGQ